VGSARGGVTALTLRYLGANAALIRVDTKKGITEFGPEMVAPGEEFSFTGVGKDQKLGTEDADLCGTAL